MFALYSVRPLKLSLLARHILEVKYLKIMKIQSSGLKCFLSNLTVPEASPVTPELYDCSVHHYTFKFCLLKLFIKQ